MKPSDAIRAFIKTYEACRLNKYNDAAGKPTIGFGHLLCPGEFLDAITQEHADELFSADLNRHAEGLSQFLKVEPTQQQFDAILSLAFNEGVRAIGNSTLVGNLNMGAVNEASFQFGKWIYIHDPASGRLVVSNGLVKRRAAERLIFDRGVYDASH